MILIWNVSTVFEKHVRKCCGRSSETLRELFRELTVSVREEAVTSL